MNLQRPDLTDRYILVAEDEFLIAGDLADTLENWGARILGPVSSIAEALHIVETSRRLDGAVLDVKLRDGVSLCVADALARRGVQFVLATGCDESDLPTPYKTSRCEKPVDDAKVARAFARPAPGRRVRRAHRARRMSAPSTRRRNHFGTEGL